MKKLSELERRAYGVLDSTKDTPSYQLMWSRRKAAKAFPQAEFDKLIVKLRASGYCFGVSALTRIAGIHDRAARWHLIDDAITGKWSERTIFAAIRERQLGRSAGGPGRKIRLPADVQAARAQIRSAVLELTNRLKAAKPVLGRPMSKKIAAAIEALENLLDGL